MQEKWVRWEPVKNLSQKYYIESIEDSLKGFTILLVDAKDSAKKISLSFPESLDIFRSTKRSLVVATVNYLDEKYGKDFYNSWSFFKVENSTYIKWAFEQSLEIFDLKYNTHFCILGINLMVDFFSTEEPEVTMITVEK